jgi:hypothetical protein
MIRLPRGRKWSGLGNQSPDVPCKSVKRRAFSKRALLAEIEKLGFAR